MIVTFIYKNNKDENKVCYGKYIGFLNENYISQEGMDIELKNIMYEKFFKRFNLELDDIIIGILGFNRDTNDYFSEDEKYIFDLLYLNWSNQPIEIYFNGKIF